LALTQKQLLDNTPGVVKLRTKVCSIRLVGAGKQIKDKKLGKCYQLMYNLRCLDGNRYVTLKYIGAKKPGLGEDREQEDGSPDENSAVWVSCTCPYHLYNTEYALAKQGSSSILYGNGKPPNIRNPHNIAYVCKHVVLALETATRDKAHKTVKEEQKPAQQTPTWHKRLVNWMTGRGQENQQQPQQLQDSQQQPQQRQDPQKQPVRQPQTSKQENQVVQQPVDETTEQKSEQQELSTDKNTKEQNQQPKTWRQRLTDWMTDKK
jgi:hypothetical protein